MKWGIRGIEEELAYVQIELKRKSSNALVAEEAALKAKLQLIKECKHAAYIAARARQAKITH